MKIRKQLWIAFTAIAILGWQSSIAEAGSEAWHLKADSQVLYGNYNGSLKRQSVSTAGVIVRADYLELGGVSLGVNGSRLTFKNGTTLDQQAFYGSGRYNLYFDALPGVLTLRMDLHAIQNNDPTGNSDGVSVFAPQISFMNYAKDLYLDIGYARSRYRNNLYVDQWTPTLGLGFNRASDWVQLRGYFIKPSNILRAQGKKRTSAAEVKWTHWLDADRWAGLENIQLSGLAGERIYAVDGDAAAVYNLADIQRGTLAMSLQWRITAHTKLMLMGGEERYTDKLIANNYSNRFVYTDLAITW